MSDIIFNETPYSPTGLNVSPERNSELTPSLTDKTYCYMLSFMKSLEATIRMELCDPSTKMADYDSNNPNLPPILLVNGLNANKPNWNALRQSLQNEATNIGPVHYVDIPHGHRTYEEDALRIQAKVDEIFSKNPLLKAEKKEIKIIAHSRGGPLAKWYEEHLAKKHDVQVKQLISIASPFKGTKLVQQAKKCFFCFNFQEYDYLEYNNEDLSDDQIDQLNQKYSHYYHISSHNDGVVYPKNSCHLNNSTPNNLYLKGEGHCSLLYSPTVHKTIIQWLKKV